MANYLKTTVSPKTGGDREAYEHAKFVQNVMRFGVPAAELQIAADYAGVANNPLTVAWINQRQGAEYAGIRGGEPGAPVLTPGEKFSATAQQAEQYASQLPVGQSELIAKLRSQIDSRQGQMIADSLMNKLPPKTEEERSAGVPFIEGKRPESKEELAAHTSAAAPFLSGETIRGLGQMEGLQSVSDIKRQGLEEEKERRAASKQTADDTRLWLSNLISAFATLNDDKRLAEQTALKIEDDAKVFNKEFIDDGMGSTTENRGYNPEEYARRMAVATTIRNDPSTLRMKINELYGEKFPDVLGSGRGVATIPEPPKPRKKPAKKNAGSQKSGAPAAKKYQIGGNSYTLDEAADLLSKKRGISVDEAKTLILNQ